MSSPRFIHLHLHSEYSLSDGLINIKALMKAIAQGGMPAVAVTDLSNLFAMVKFYRAALAAGIKPIIGADVWIEDSKPHRMVLLCQNHQGYKNLTRLISRAYTEGQKNGLPLINKKWLSESAAGLIALSGAQEGNIGQAILANQPQQAATLLTEWLEIFADRFYLELQRTGQDHETFYIQSALTLASHHQVPVVATNNVRFLTSQDFEAHEARVCIREGWSLNDERRPRPYTDQQYIRNEAEMVALFHDIPSALANSVEIAKRCNLDLVLDKSFLPNFSVPDGMTMDGYFEQLAKLGLEKRFTALGIKEENTAPYHDRLQMEISVIQRMGFTGYFLIVADFVGWAKNKKIPVAPGRGSGAGSLVAYVLEITDLDPIAHELLFERFLNPERVSMPDFDIDFCMEGRDRVIDYVSQKYGAESVAQIITYGSMAAKAVVRDVGRVLGYGYGFVDKIAKLIPFEIGMTLKKALTDEPLLQARYEKEEEVKTLIDLAMKLEGAPRNVGKHAAGVVIAPSVLTDFTPLYCEPGGANLVTQFDKDDVEAVGLVKFDFLGLRTLTIMDWAVDAINARLTNEHKPLIDLRAIPIDDKATFELLKSCQTIAVFQLESRGFQDLIRRLQPDHFDDIMALVALFRPGPLQSGMVDDFINRKHGRDRVEYPHPKLEPILRPTYGVIIYQEQVMQIAQVLAGYTLGSADILRKAMGKKKPEEMAKQRAIFVDGSESRGVDGRIANQIFDIMEKFAGYGFNKSHSASYALLAYQTAWLKTHYPAEFMAAVLSSDMDNTDKVVRLIEDCQNFNLKINAPDINHSAFRFTVTETGSILYGLGAIKGVGSAAVENILEVRKAVKHFGDFFTFCQQVDTRKVNRKVLEALIRSGAMDCFQQTRAVLSASVESALQAAEQNTRSQSVGQTDLFGDVMFADNQHNLQLNYPIVSPWREEDRLQGEKETLGWYMSGHPISRFEAELNQFISGSISSLRPSRDKSIVIAGYVTAIRTLQTKSGARMAYLTLVDRTGRIDVAILAKLYDSCRHLLAKDQLLVIEGEVGIDNFTENYKLTAVKLCDLSQARQQYAKHLALDLFAEQLGPNAIIELKETLLPFIGGHCKVLVAYHQATATANFALGDEWRIKPEQKLIDALHKMVGEKHVRLNYG